MTNAIFRVRGIALAAALLMAPAPVLAQGGKSAALATELARLMDQMKLDSLAARSTAPDLFVGALYFPGSQLLVVSAKYSVPALLNEKLTQKNYRDVYIDLNSASVPQSKVFISDLGANGLQADPDDNQPYDTAEFGGKTVSFDGDWRKAKLTEEEYQKSFETAEQRYIEMLQALLTQLKKTS